MTTDTLPSFLDVPSAFALPQTALDSGRLPDGLTRRDLSLAEFVREAWPVLEGSRRLEAGWYIDAICEHLEAVTDGKIRSLVINLPPRFAKSSLVSVLWPTWEWTFRPWRSWLFSSYASELSERDNRRARHLIDSTWFQTRFGNRFTIPHARGSKDSATRFENDCGGYRIATSVGGVVTGEGADVVVVDDPLKAEDAMSDVKRNAANMWWAETMASRLNDPRSGAKVIVMQRLHEDDLTGYVLRGEGGYVHLCLPMEYEAEYDEVGNPVPKLVTPLGWSDPRSEQGELLCASRIGPTETARLRAEIGEYGWASQYQQRPAPRGGGMFRIDRIEVVPSIPSNGHYMRVRSWDRAGTPGGGAYTAGVRMCKDFRTNTYYIEHVHRGQWSTDRRDAETRTTAQGDGRYCGILLEQEPGSAGLDSVRGTARMLDGYRVIPIKPTGSKEVRAEPLASQLALGNVKLVAGPWNRDFQHELELFPFSRYRDQVDACTQAYNWLCEQQPRRVGLSVSGPRRW
jgi:predicted phage terminase large subunit-like protein